MTLIAILLAVGLETETDALVARLSHPDVEVRDQAESDLILRGAAALPVLRDKPGSQHAVARILDGIEWNHKARLQRGWRCVAEMDPCPLVFTEPDVALADLFPDSQIIVARGEGPHCYRHCWGGWVVGVAARDGSTFTIRSPGFGTGVPTIGDVRSLRREMKPVRSQEEAIEAVSAIIGIPSTYNYTAWDVGGGTAVRAPALIEDRLFLFDEKGRLHRRSEAERPSK